MEETKTFGERFKQLRKDKKLTQKTVAFDLGLGQSAIANYEHGTRFPDEKTLKKITIYFNTSLDYLMDIKRNTSPLNNQINLNEIMEKYKKLIIDNSFKEGLELLLWSQEIGIELLTIYQEIIIPVLRHIGYLWESSIINVAKEHLISEEIEKTVSILSFKTSHNEINRLKCVCATAGPELHRIPIKMISELLRNLGSQTWYLGVNTPTKDIIEFCKENSADVLILSSTMDSSLDSVNNIIGGLRSDKTLNNCKIIVGGDSFIRNPKAWKIANADFMASTIPDVLSIIFEKVIK